jgi:replicative DNA helicase
MTDLQMRVMLDRWNKLSPQEQEKFESLRAGVDADNALKLRQDFKVKALWDYEEDIRKAAAHWNKPKGLLTGYYVLDKMTMGLAPGELTIIGGATSNGKTALALNISAKLAQKDSRVLFVTLEMTHVEVGSRLMKISSNKEKVLDNVFLQEKDELSWQSIDGLIETAKKEAEVDIVIIDHLHYFTRELQHVAEELGNITKELKKNAIRHQLPVILISHTRKGMSNNGKRVTTTSIDDLRGSSYIAQDADIVIMVQRDLEFPDKILIKKEKNRNRYGCPDGTDYLLPFVDTEILDQREGFPY